VNGALGDDGREGRELAALLEEWIARLSALHVEIVASGAACASAARAAAAALEKRASVRVVEAWSDAGKSDAIIVYGETAHDGWAAQLAELGKLSARALIVVVRNPRGILDRLASPPLAPMCHTSAIAPVLWQIGRVREHVFFDGGRLAHALEASPKLQARVARMHAFLVDTAPRTPQARRKLHTVS
jgi:hypothetical protein